MKITKRQLKRVIREEYSRLQRRGLIKEYGENPGGFEGPSGGEGMYDAMLDMVMESEELEGLKTTYDVIVAAEPSIDDFCSVFDGGPRKLDDLISCLEEWKRSLPAQYLRDDCKRILNAIEMQLGLMQTM